VTLVISMLGFLGIILLAILVMIRVISVEQAGAVFIRGLVAFLLVVWALCIVKGLLPVALRALERLMPWLTIVCLVAIGLLVLLHVTARWARHREKQSKRGDRDV